MSDSSRGSATTATISITTIERAKAAFPSAHVRSSSASRRRIACSSVTDPAMKDTAMMPRVIAPVYSPKFERFKPTSPPNQMYAHWMQDKKMTTMNQPTQGTIHTVRTSSSRALSSLRTGSAQERLPQARVRSMARPRNGMDESAATAG